MFFSCLTRRAVRLPAMCVLLVCIALSCAQPSQSVVFDKTKLYGTWRSSYGDQYVITETSFKSYNSSNDEECAFAWEIVEISPTENGTNTWYIYGKITDPGYYTQAGNYTAAYVEIIGSGDGLKLSCAYKDPIDEDSKLETVKTEFTDSNGYYSYKAEYVRQ